MCVQRHRDVRSSIECCLALIPYVYGHYPVSSAVLLLLFILLSPRQLTVEL